MSKSLKICIPSNAVTDHALHKILKIFSLPSILMHLQFMLFYVFLFLKFSPSFSPILNQQIHLLSILAYRCSLSLHNLELSVIISMPSFSNACFKLL